ncbi:MAG: WecB/TagA/CpsF family glycosyltransferase [Candidatus Gottesmanbacteria bacterium]|nr:WecB/TagA/CpsF family glycosyltransferase [Candidatus Gottesmanbacteria bacterium]
MKLASTKILGISVTASPKDEIVEHVRKYLELSNYPIIQLSNKNRKPLVIVTPNPEQIIAAQTDKHFAEILNGADVAIPDGIGLVAALRFLGKDVGHKTQDIGLQRIPGVEFMEDLVAMAAAKGWPVALIGGRDGVAQEALGQLKIKYPGLVGWAEEPEEMPILPMSNATPAKRDPRCCNPINIGNSSGTILKYYQYTKDIIEKIRKTRICIVFVGLGAPKQEFFIEQLAHILSFRPLSRNPEKKEWIPGQARDDRKSIVFMSVGGSFDIIAGRVPRAPHFFRSLGLEWLWRLVIEPWRFGRQLRLLQFLWLVLGKKLASSSQTWRS